MTSYSASYKSVWIWKDDHLESYETIEKSPIVNTQSRHLIGESDEVIQFADNVDQDKERLFKQKYQRNVRKDFPCVVTIQDIKDVVTYLAKDQIPKDFLALFHSNDINSFFRALIVYFQLYLQVKEDLNYRKNAYKTQLKHPTSIVRETICLKQLSFIRGQIGQQYALIIVGSGLYNRFHHMNNPLNYSCSVRDINLYKLLMSFSLRVVWLALNRTYFKEIENEMARLFGSKSINSEYSINLKSITDEKILHGEVTRTKQHWSGCSAVIKDIYLNEDKHKLVPNNFQDYIFENITISGLQALLNMPEEFFESFGLVLGIIGLPRTNFEPMLHAREEETKSMNDESSVTDESTPLQSPTVKLYHYLDQLNTLINLNDFFTEYGVDYLKTQLILYDNIKNEDSKNAFTVWCKPRQ